VIAYLSGAMEYANDEGAGWRKELANWLQVELNHDVIDPVEESKALMLQEGADNYREWKQSDPQRYIAFIRKCIDRDLRAIMHEVDYVICLWNEAVFKGAGTHGEVTVAYQQKLPIYLVTTLDPSDLSGWIMACSTEIFQNFDELKKALIKSYR